MLNDLVFQWPCFYIESCFSISLSFWPEWRFTRFHIKLDLDLAGCWLLFQIQPSDQGRLGFGLWQYKGGSAEVGQRNKVYTMSFLPVYLIYAHFISTIIENKYIYISKMNSQRDHGKMIVLISLFLVEIQLQWEKNQDHLADFLERALELTWCMKMMIEIFCFILKHYFIIRNWD